MQFAQPYPQMYQQPGVGGFPMPQMMPNMAGSMFTVPPQMWIQPSVAPSQPAAMKVDEDASRSQDTKSSSTKAKKDKGKAKASEAFIHQQ
jgi:hypothetical protein